MSPPISGQTRLAGVIGWPVRHSVSPTLHNAAFTSLGLDWVYVAMPVPPGSAGAALAGMAALGIDGLSVTMPHKDAVAACVDRLTGDATALGAVNCVYRDDDQLVGDNTDGGGFVASLRRDEDLDPSGMHCAVVGAGGAARAVIRALAVAGAERVTVVNRREERARTAAALAGERGRIGTEDDLDRVDLVVNATPVGMGGDSGMPFDPGVLHDWAVVVDLVYHPRVTPLLAEVAESGRRGVGGLGMLVHQAARAFERWTGVAAPIEVMTAAGREAVS
ncbi:MAG: shikimate dehydrogenase [Acidimicrobiales bacterium]|nr:shikimate dehydrogenase [Acidimicrobiales bacterium]